MKIENLKKDIDDINTEIERFKLKKTEGLQAEINDLKLQIDRLSIEEGMIKNIRVIQDPEASIRPIKPKKRRNVLLAGVVAFMMMMFLAFFVEFIQKAKSNNTIK
jgi:capsular polysaccharide biosynthesis protein